MTERVEHPPLILEIAAALLVPAASFGFVRLFLDREPTTAAIGSAVAASLLAAVLRRLRVPIVPALLLSLVGLALLLSQRFAPGTQQWGIVPTGETQDQLRTLTELGAEQYRKVRAPIESFDGFVAGVMVAAWMMATLTDWAALRLRLAFEPVLPAALIFGFSSVLGSGQSQLLSTLVFGLAVVVWAIAQRWTTLRTSFLWLASDKTRGPSAVVRTAAAVSGLALVVGISATPFLPGSDSDEIYSFRATSAPTRSPITPFVEIGQRLVEQSDVNLFTVETDSPQYWRVSGLEKYDGERAVWTTSTSFVSADGDVDAILTSPGTTETIQYTVTIDNLTIDNVGEIWAPAAYATSRVIDSSVPLSWNKENATLTIDGDDTAAFGPGDTYTLESVTPLFTAAELQSASADIPSDIAEVYLELPDNLSPRIQSEATAITAGLTTDYDRALALQDHFRAFQYSLELSPRVGDPVEQFLDEQIGFCQQFSGTFALMARELGIPARVAIGYTWGDKVEGEENLYQIKGRHAHAWPEVWLGEYGWVAFEPTPNRGAPAGQAYTGQPASQDSVDPSLSDPNDTLGTPSTQPPRNPGDIDGPDFATGESVPPVIVAKESWRPPTWLLGFFALIALYLVAVPLIRQARLMVRRTKAHTPREKVDLAWAETVDELSRSMDLRREPAETRNEFANRAGRDRRLEAEPLAALSNVATMALYDPTSADDASAEQARQSSRAVIGRVHERVNVRQRWRRDIDPRTWRR